MNFLFCTAPQGPPERTGYDHAFVALAEGLEQENAGGSHHSWSGTVPYWRKASGEWLIPCDGRVTWENADVVVVSYLLLGDGLGLPAELHHLRPSVRTVFLDAMDGWRAFFLRPEMRRFDLVLRTHLSERYPIPKNVKPWAFGLSERILEATKDVVGWSDRQPQFLFNFRVGHPLRDWARKAVVPKLELRFPCNTDTDEAPTPDSTDVYRAWAQTGRRHYPGYFHRLGRSALGAAYGGYFAPDCQLSLDSPWLRVLYKGLQLTRSRSRTIVQFDSWRLWETMAAGALTVHVDLSRYGAVLPVQPLNRVHYWAISPDRAESDIEELLKAPSSRLAAIAEEGRIWARENYGPRAQAKRLLSHLGI